jgi:hypothetical protein
MMTTAKSLACTALLVLVGGLAAAPVGAQPRGEVTRVDGETLYVQLDDSITVDAGTVGRVVEERVVDGEAVRLTYAVLSVQEVERPVGGPWVAACKITRQSRNLEAGDPVAFDTVSPRARLVVRTEPPGATVTVDGTEVGETPLDESIGTGVHELQLTRMGYRSINYSFLVQTGETQRIADTLQTAIGRLTVTSLPDSATVRLGDEPFGTTPVAKDVQEGTYTLRVQRGGYLPHEQTVTVEGGSDQQVNVPLKRPLRVSAAEQQDDEVANVTVDREGERLIVTYNLVGNVEAYAVDLLLSTNGGQTFEAIPETVAGAVGGSVAPGKGKQIVWAATEDFPRGLTGTGNRLRVRAEPDGGGGLYWVVGSVLTAGAGAATAAILGVFGGGGGGGGDLPDAPPPAPN